MSKAEGMSMHPEDYSSYLGHARDHINRFINGEEYTSIESAIKAIDSLPENERAEYAEDIIEGRLLRRDNETHEIYDAIKLIKKYGLDPKKYAWEILRCYGDEIGDSEVDELTVENIEPEIQELFGYNNEDIQELKEAVEEDNKLLNDRAIIEDAMRKRNGPKDFLYNVYETTDEEYHKQ